VQLDNPGNRPERASPVGRHGIRPATSDPGDRRGTPTSRDRRLAVVVFRRPTGGGVECNSTIPGIRPEGLVAPPGRHPEPAARDPGDRRGTPTSRDRRLAVVVFRRPDGRRGRVQLDNPGNRPEGLHPPAWPGRPQATPAIVAERRHPGIDDLQSSSSAGPRGGGVECNSTIPGTALKGLGHPPGRHPAGHTRPRRSSRNADIPGSTTCSRRLPPVRRAAGRVQLDNPGNRPAGSVTPPWLCLSGRPQATPAIVAERRQPGIDDLQSSSSAGPTGGGVECNSTIPGTALKRHSTCATRRSSRSGRPCC
jgi:hypothetical protein